jgi:hypothetical protein
MITILKKTLGFFSGRGYPYEEVIEIKKKLFFRRSRRLDKKSQAAD